MPRPSLDDFSKSKLGLSLASGVGKATPPAVGRRLASRTADLISSRRDLRVVEAVRANQWVRSGGTLVGGELDAVVRETLRHSARCIYDYYHLADEPDALGEFVTISKRMLEWIERVRGGRAVVFGAPHLSNIDLAGMALARAGFRAQVLTVPDPTDAYRAQNELRRAAGLDATPISPTALRMARGRLEGGGAILTGVDRPLPGSKRAYAFFGRPAHVPDVHVRLAVHASAPFVVVWAVMTPDGLYAVDCDEVPLTSDTSHDATRHNAEAVLARVAIEIDARPTQWIMPHAVWPDAVRELREAEDGLERGA